MKIEGEGGRPGQGETGLIYLDQGETRMSVLEERLGCAWAKATIRESSRGDCGEQSRESVWDWRECRTSSVDESSRVRECEEQLVCEWKGVSCWVCLVERGTGEKIERSKGVVGDQSG